MPIDVCLYFLTSLAGYPAQCWYTIPNQRVLEAEENQRKKGKEKIKEKGNAYEVEENFTICSRSCCILSDARACVKENGKKINTVLLSLLYIYMKYR